MRCAVAGGDTKTDITALGRKDEIGEMAEAVQVFKDNMIEADRLRSEQERQKKRAEVEAGDHRTSSPMSSTASVKGVVNSGIVGVDARGSRRRRP